MQNFLGNAFIRTQVYSEIFKSALNYLSYKQYCLIFVAEKTNKKSKETNRIFKINQKQALGLILLSLARGTSFWSNF